MQYCPRVSILFLLGVVVIAVVVVVVVVIAVVVVVVVVGTINIVLGCTSALAL